MLLNTEVFWDVTQCPLDSGSLCLKQPLCPQLQGHNTNIKEGQVAIYLEWSGYFKEMLVVYSEERDRQPPFLPQHCHFDPGEEGTTVLWNTGKYSPNKCSITLLFRLESHVPSVQVFSWKFEIVYTGCFILWSSLVYEGGFLASCHRVHTEQKLPSVFSWTNYNIRTNSMLHTCKNKVKVVLTTWNI